MRQGIVIIVVTIAFVGALNLPGRATPVPQGDGTLPSVEEYRKDLEELLTSVNHSQSNLLRIERKLDMLLGNEYEPQVRVSAEAWKEVIKAATVIIQTPVIEEDAPALAPVPQRVTDQ